MAKDKTPRGAAEAAPELGPGPALALRVTARQGSFWRGGLQFGTAPRDVPLAGLSAEAEQAIRGEPMLLVQTVAIEGEPAPAAADAQA